MKKWSAFIDKYMPGADRTDNSLVRLMAPRRRAG